MTTIAKFKRQSQTSRELNQLRREVLPGKEKFVWAVFNSGEPLWNNNPCAIELVLFESKHVALDFVRELLHKYWGIDASKFDDDAVMDAMWNQDSKDQEPRYLHLYELKVHPDDYLTLNFPF